MQHYEAFYLDIIFHKHKRVQKKPPKNSHTEESRDQLLHAIYNEAKTEAKRTLY